MLPLFHRELAEVLDGLAGEYDVEVIYVDDGSRDGTLALLRRLAATGSARALPVVQPQLRPPGRPDRRPGARPRRRGRHDGLRPAAPARLLPALLRQWQEGHDVVLTIREEDPTAGAVQALSVALLLPPDAPAERAEVRMAASPTTGCCRARPSTRLLRLRESHRFLRGMVQWLGFPAAEVRFAAAAAEGRACPSTRCGRLLNLAGDGILSFSRVPLRVAVFLGAAAVVVRPGLRRLLAWPGSPWCAAGGAGLDDGAGDAVPARRLHPLRAGPGRRVRRPHLRAGEGAAAVRPGGIPHDAAAASVRDEGWRDRHDLARADKETSPCRILPTPGPALVRLLSSSSCCSWPSRRGASWWSTARRSCRGIWATGRYLRTAWAVRRDPTICHAWMTTAGIADYPAAVRHPHDAVGQPSRRRRPHGHASLRGFRRHLLCGEPGAGRKGAPVAGARPKMLTMFVELEFVGFVKM